MKFLLFAPFLFLLGTGTAQSAANLETCLACHGAAGTSQTPLTPSLGGMPSFYVVAQLFLFRGGRRASEVMEPMAKDLSDSDLTSLAAAISKLPAPKPLPGDSDVSRLASGRSLISKNNCGSCHGADFSGDRNVPRIANQREDYLLKALRDYKGNKRVGYGNAVMPETVSGLNDAELADIAYYLARFKR